ncbi:hypothetical protein HOO65_050773 [Ceratocystis lukuohia]|uniref:Metalloprotease m41 ftsh n=1 Tax=Ceratocystis lukuohia TaxID=2019550 RepID=A0ABR4MH94_9PEZI
MENLDLTNIEALTAALVEAKALIDEKDSKLVEAKALIDEKDSKLVEAKAHADAETTRADAEKKRADAEKKRADAATAKQSLHAHIYHLYAHCFQTLRVRQKGPETTAASSTSVLGRTCPRKLLPWNEFPELHQQKFTDLSNAFGDKLLLPPLSRASAVQEMAQEVTHASEIESSLFCSLVIEFPVAKIASTWRQIVSEEVEKVEFHPNTAYIKKICEQVHEYNMQGSDDENSPDEFLDLSSIRADIPEPVTVVSAFASRGRRPSLDISNAGRNLKRPATSPPDPDRTQPIKMRSPERRINPDGTFLRRVNESPNVKNLLVIEHKPAHVFTPDLLCSALKDIVDSGSRIFTESIDPGASSPASGKIENLKNQEHPPSSQLVAKALVQTYNYMVTLGLSYGYLSTGQATILLHINYKEPSELYFHLCVHQKDVSDIPRHDLDDSPAQDSEISSALENGIKNTPYAMVMTMIQLAFNSTNLSVQQIASIQNRLPRFHGSKKPPSDPSSGSGKGNESGNTGSSSLRNPYPQFPPPDGRSSSQHEHDPSKKKQAVHVDSYTNSSTCRLPRPEYCSQRCLLGLANGGYLDQSCPNVNLHCKEPSFESSSASVHKKHQISLSQLVDIVKAQLDTNLDSDCEVQPNKSGLLGILVKLTAHPYGYTFVGKGMLNLALPFIRHELKVYYQLRPVQGEVVPVCLGHVSMQQTLNYGFQPIRQMLLLSYAGEPVMEMDYGVVNNLESRLLALGVVHGDVREANVTHDAQSGRTMLIDFHRSQIIKCPPDSWRIGYYEDAAVQKTNSGNSWDNGRPVKRVHLET